MFRRVVASSGFWALIDQALVSLGGMTTSVILARSLQPAAFGVYVLLFGAMLLLNTVHTSLVDYPLSIRGAHAAPADMPHLTGAFLALALLCAFPLVVPLGVMTGVLASWHVVPWAIIALIAWQCQETARRALFADLRLRAAILGDIVSYLGQALVILLLAQRGDLTLRAVFAVMLVTSLAGLLLQLSRIRPRVVAAVSISALVRVSLNDGRWVLLSNLLGSFIMQGLLWMLALVEHAREVADLQAVITIVGVANPVMFGMGNLLMPVMARAGQTGSTSEARQQFAAAFSLGGLLLVPYTLLLWIFPGHILRLIYGASSPYAELTTPLRLLALAYLLVYVAHVANAALFGLERLHTALMVQLAGTVALIAGGLFLTIAWGVTGAAVATLLVHLVRSIFSLRGLQQAFLPNDRRLAHLMKSA